MSRPISDTGQVGGQSTPQEINQTPCHMGVLRDTLATLNFDRVGNDCSVARAFEQGRSLSRPISNTGQLGAQTFSAFGPAAHSALWHEPHWVAAQHFPKHEGEHSLLQGATVLWRYDHSFWVDVRREKRVDYSWFAYKCNKCRTYDKCKCRTHIPLHERSSPLVGVSRLCELSTTRASTSR